MRSSSCSRARRRSQLSAALAVTAGHAAAGGVVAGGRGGRALGDALATSSDAVSGSSAGGGCGTPRVKSALSWARDRLRERTALGAVHRRFIPFARLAVNLAAGASRIAAPRYLLFASLAACGWALYQALIGAVIATMLPGAPVVAVSCRWSSRSSSVRRSTPCSRGEPAARETQRKRRTMTDATADHRLRQRASWGGAVPMPMPAVDVPVAELAYPHFSVTLDRATSGGVTGVNIDGATLADLARTGDWEYDPRVPASEQAGPAVYVDNDLDRGHLVRRRDPGWGTTAEARARPSRPSSTPTPRRRRRCSTSRPTCGWVSRTMCSPSRREGLRVSVFTAPVLEHDDPPYRGVRLPRRFWKVAAWVTAADSRWRLPASCSTSRG